MDGKLRTKDGETSLIWLETETTGYVEQSLQFTKAYNDYSRPITRYLALRLNSPKLADEVEDLVQEVFKKFWQYTIQGKEIKYTQAFLYKTAQNLVIDHYRKNLLKSGGDKEESLDILTAVKNNVEPSYDGRSGLEKNITFGRIVDFIKTCLSKSDRRILVMRYIQGLKPKEIALILGTNTGNISNKIYQAVKRIQATRIDPTNCNLKIINNL